MLLILLFIFIICFTTFAEYSAQWAGADPGIFERGGPKAIIYKTVERGGPKTLKMAFECSFQSFSNKSFANIPQKGGAQAPWAPPLNPPLVGAWGIGHVVVFIYIIVYTFWLCKNILGQVKKNW